MSHSAWSGENSNSTSPPNIERPRTVEALAPGFEIVHMDAVARVKRLESTNLNEEIQYADGTMWTIADLLWRKLLLHSIHHRGQLTLLCRLAGGVPPALFGRTREQAIPALRDRVLARAAKSGEFLAKRYEAARLAYPYTLYESERLKRLSVSRRRRCT